MRMLWCFGGVVVACGLLGETVVVQAQQTSGMDQVLAEIERNTELYAMTVPSFVCKEHIVSQEVHKGEVKRETSADAVFSVTRSTSKANALEESREIKVIDGRPAGSRRLTLPLSFSGGFSGALNKFLSSDHRSCFDYARDTAMVWPDGRAGFTFVARPDAARDPACGTIQPGTTGKFTVDTATMQVVHIERTVPNPVGKDLSVMGTAAVDFAPVTLNGKSFWLPTAVSAFTTETAKTDGVRFSAHYSEYHRFAATATIVPADQ